MPSIIPGYEYDIFISYRQNDNQDGWVTEFIDSLNREIKSTFKESISIYFDENPYDGLGETHDVDDSLANKLKCLIFIPIISKTYCDPNSFAWTNEFLAFNKLTSNDEYGLKVVLLNGNTASRVLPIRIHDIDDADKKLVEDEIGFLRSIDFVYQSAGVNRPLTPNDERDLNLHKTIYRDQINKVANAIQEIIGGLKNSVTESIEKEVSRSTPTTSDPSIENKPNGKSKSLIAYFGLVLILALVYFFYTKNDNDTIREGMDKSIAVIPFKIIGNDEEGGYFAEGVMDAILNNLSKIKELEVRSRTSVEQYIKTQKSIKEIGAELGVSYILEGSAQKIDNDIRIIVQLINAVEDKHIWSNDYEAKYENIFELQQNISQRIANELQVQISPEESLAIQVIPTTNLEAYDYYLRGKDYTSRYLLSRNERDFQNATQLLQQAIGLDPEFSYAYAQLGTSLLWSDLDYANNIRDDFIPIIASVVSDSVLALSNKAINLDPDNAYAYSVRGWSFWKKGLIKNAKDDFNYAIILNPKEFRAFKALGLLHLTTGEHEKTFNNFKKASEINQNHSNRPIDYTDVGLLYSHFGDFEKAEFYFREALKLQPNFYWGFKNLRWLEILQGNFNEAIKFSERSLASVPDNALEYLNHAQLLALMGDFSEAKEYLLNGFNLLEGKGKILNQIEGGYILWNNGNKEEALERFSKKIIYCEESIKNNTLYGMKRAAYDLAGIHAFLGNEEDAYKWLRYYEKSGFRGGLEYYITYDPLFKNLRDEKEFKEIVSNAHAINEVTKSRIRELEKEGELLLK